MLTKLPPKLIVEAMEKELKHGTTQSRSFTILVLSPHFKPQAGFGSRTDNLSNALASREAEIMKALIDLPSEEEATLRDWALSLVIVRAKATKTPLREIDGLLPKLRQILNAGEDASLVMTAAIALVIAEPDNPQLLPTLIREISPEGTMWQAAAARNLGRLGPRAAPAVKAPHGSRQHVVEAV